MMMIINSIVETRNSGLETEEEEDRKGIRSSLEEKAKGQLMVAR